MSFLNDLGIDLDAIFGSGGYLDDFIGQVDEALFSGPSSSGGSSVPHNPNLEFTDPFDTEDNPISTGDPALDTILRMIRQNMFRARDSASQLEATGASQEDLARALEPLQGQLGRIDAASGRLSGLTEELIGSSLGSTAGAQIAAINAARLSGDGRFGGGGNAALLAARAAQGAASQQSGALGQALVQGRLGEATFENNLLQQRGGIARALADALSGQAGLKEERARIGQNLDTQFAQILGGFVGPLAGIEQSQIGRSAGREQAYIGVLGQAVGSSGGINLGGG